MNTWRKIIFVINSENHSEKTITCLYHQHEEDDDKRLIPCPNFKGEEIICPECQEKYSDKSSTCITLEKKVNTYWIKELYFGKYLYDFNLSKDWHIHSDKSKHKTVKSNGQIICNDCANTFNVKTDIEIKAIHYKKHSLPVINEIQYYLFKAAPIWLKLKKENGEFQHFFLDSNSEEIIEAIMDKERLISMKDHQQETFDFIFEITKELSPQIFAKVNSFKKQVNEKLGNDSAKTLPYDMHLIIMQELKGNVEKDFKGKKKEKTLLMIPETTKIPLKTRRRHRDSGTQKFNNKIVNATEVIKSIPVHTGEYEVIADTTSNLEEEELEREKTQEMLIPVAPIIPHIPEKKPKEPLEESSEEEILVDAENSDPISEEEDSSDYKTVEPETFEKRKTDKVIIELTPKQGEPEAKATENSDETNNEFVSEKTATIDPENLSTETIDENFPDFDASMAELEKELAECDEVEDTVFAATVMALLTPMIMHAMKEIAAAESMAKTMISHIVEIRVPEKRVELLNNWAEELNTLKTQVLEDAKQLSTQVKNILEKTENDSDKAIELLGEILEEMASAESDRILEVERTFQASLEETLLASKKSVKNTTDEILTENGIIISKKLEELSNKIDSLKEKSKSWYENYLLNAKESMEVIRSILIKEQSESQAAFNDHLKVKTDESTEAIRLAGEKGCQIIKEDTVKSCKKVRRAAPFLIAFFIFITLIAGALMFSLYWTNRQQIKTLKAERAENKRSFEENKARSKTLAEILKKQIAESNTLNEKFKQQKKNFAKLEESHKKNIQTLEENAEDQKRKWHYFRKNANTEWSNTQKTQEKDFSNMTWNWQSISQYYWEEIEKDLKRQKIYCNLDKKETVNKNLPIPVKKIAKITPKLAKKPKSTKKAINRPAKKKKAFKAKTRRKDNPPPLLIVEYDEDGKEIKKK